MPKLTLVDGRRIDKTFCKLKLQVAQALFKDCISLLAALQGKAQLFKVLLFLLVNLAEFHNFCFALLDFHLKLSKSWFTLFDHFLMARGSLFLKTLAKVCNLNSFLQQLLLGNDSAQQLLNSSKPRVF